MDMYKKRELRAKKRLENEESGTNNHLNLSWARCKYVNML